MAILPGHTKSKRLGYRHILFALPLSHRLATDIINRKKEDRLNRKKED
jgi:hypothetical protein